jgi:hypothetical protein
MSIIFEGVDGTGKTTNIKQFMMFNRNYKYVHNWTKPKNKTDILSEATKEILLLNDSFNVLLDRSFIISEYIYSTVLDRETPITFEYVQKLVELMNRKDHTLKLFYFYDIESLVIKSEDIDLPFNKLNDLYLETFTNRVRLTKLLLENIDERII